MNKSFTSIYNCLIAVTSDQQAFLIKSEPNISEVFDGCDLDDNISERGSIPRTAGIYKCEIELYSYWHDPRFEPGEWETDFSILNIEEIHI